MNTTTTTQKKKESFKVGDIIQDISKEGELLLVLGYTNIPVGIWYSKQRMVEGISLNKKTGEINTFVRVSQTNEDGNLIKVGYWDITKHILTTMSNVSDAIFPEYKDNKILYPEKQLTFYGD